jgi:hypothetical protein
VTAGAIEGGGATLGALVPEPPPQADTINARPQAPIIFGTVGAERQRKSSPSMIQLFYWL